MSNDKQIQRWADPAMFEAEPVDDRGPKVYLLEMTSDPLGSIAALSAMYTGKVTRSKDAVTDEERAHHLREMQLTKLTTPLEAVKFHFMIEGVTRAFTHQLVRNRTSAYAQESMRFAVKEDMPVALPPSLAGVELPEGWEGLYLAAWLNEPAGKALEYARLSDKVKQRIVWEQAVANIRRSYNYLVDAGMPAEDARGLAPTNVLTRINWVTDLRTLIDVLGVRLCTQAQFEWRAVATQIAAAIGEAYKDDRRLITLRMLRQLTNPSLGEMGALEAKMERIEREYHEIASLFRPICYKTGKCEFMSHADRACSIRDRVEANHSIGRPSSDWSKPMSISEARLMGIDIGPIHPEEWMFDPGAAR